MYLVSNAFSRSFNFDDKEKKEMAAFREIILSIHGMNREKR